MTSGGTKHPSYTEAQLWKARHPMKIVLLHLFLKLASKKILQNVTQQTPHKRLVLETNNHLFRTSHSKGSWLNFLKASTYKLCSRAGTLFQKSVHPFVPSLIAVGYLKCTWCVVVTVCFLLRNRGEKGPFIYQILKIQWQANNTVNGFHVRTTECYFLGNFLGKKYCCSTCNRPQGKDEIHAMHASIESILQKEAPCQWLGLPGKTQTKE